MRIIATSCLVGAIVACGALDMTTALGQDNNERSVEQYACKDILRESGANRDVAIAFLHGFLLGKSGGSKFNLDTLRKQTDAFLERCLDNPKDNAIDAMVKVKG